MEKANALSAVEPYRFINKACFVVLFLKIRFPAQFPQDMHAALREDRRLKNRGCRRLDEK
jgi:hypothetical protein